MPSGIQTVSYRFERIEKKFRLSAWQYEAILPLLQDRMERDAYGETAVCNIYYDTPDYSLIRRSIERPFFKEKLRLRSYGIPKENDPVFVEIKRKLDGIGYKRRIRVPFGEAKKLLGGEKIACDDPQIGEELLAFVERYHPIPMVFLTYRRFAMTAKDDPDFRVTFDRDLCFRTENPEKPGEDGMTPILKDDSEAVMEIKALGAIPLWLTDAMSELKIRQVPFSKIGECFSRHIAPLAFPSTIHADERT